MFITGILTFGQDKGKREKVEDTRILGLPVSGYASAKSRYRTTSGEKDWDLYEYLFANVGDTEKDKVSFTFFGRLTEDVDGNNFHDKGFQPFDSITDTFKSNVNGRLYEAYFNFRDVGPIETTRVGRQEMFETPVVVFFDGARMTTARGKDWDVRFTAYSGIPVHFFESSRAGDWLTGGALEVGLFSGNKERIDALAIEDRVDDETRRNTLYGFSAKQDFTELLKFPLSMQLKSTMLDSRSRDYTALLTYNDVEKDLMLQYSFYELAVPQADLVTEFDPYSVQMRSLFPYFQNSFLVHKGIGANFGVDAGWTNRFLRFESDETTFNHEFTRYYITPSAYKWPNEKMDFSLTFEIWDSNPNDFKTYGLDVTYRFTDKFKATFGTNYQLYVYDYYSVEERTRVRTYYVRGEYKLRDSLKLNVRVSIESDDFDDYTIFELGARYTF